MPETYVVHLGNSKELMEIAEDSVSRRVLREHVRESLGVRNEDLLFAIVNSMLSLLFEFLQLNFCILNFEFLQLNLCNKFPVLFFVYLCKSKGPCVVNLQVFRVEKVRIYFFVPFMKVCKLSRRRICRCHLCMQ